MTAAASADEYAPLLEANAEGAGALASEAVPSSPRINENSEHDYRHRLPPGTRIGDHLIVRGVLGEGGTAVVYEALHTRLGASVALKVIDVSNEFMEGAHARLVREAHVCASLEDPHIPRIYDVGELPDGTPYVVMERVSGRTLENVLVQGALPLDIAVQITEDLLMAVDAIERAGVVHRDIKPPNIILQTNGEGVLRVRLMDFGVSKNVGTDREPTQQVLIDADPTLTQHGAIVGTPHYMAPEQIVGPAVDSRADLYAVGVVAYEMISGRTAFEGETTGDVVAAVLHTRPLPLRRLRDVHDALESWVDKAMSPRRSDRFQSARQMREALREAWEEHLEQAGARGQRRWAKRARVAGALGLVAVGMMLPMPASYDTGFSRFLGRSAAPTANAAAAATPSSPAELLRQGAAVVSPQPAAAEALRRPGESEWDLAQAVEASAQASAAAEAANGQRQLAPQAAASSVAGSGPVRRAVLARPGRSQREVGNGASAEPVPPPRVFGAVVRPQPSAAVPVGQRGVSINDYVQKLDSLTNHHAAPAQRPVVVDKNLPDNPYGD